MTGYRNVRRNRLSGEFPSNVGFHDLAYVLLVHLARSAQNPQLIDSVFMLKKNARASVSKEYTNSTSFGRLTARNAARKLAKAGIPTLDNDKRLSSRAR